MIKHNYLNLIAWGHVDKVKEILDKKGTKVHGLLEPSVLALTISYNQYDMCKLLIERGTPLNYLDPQGFTFLHLCVLYDNIKIMKLLIEKGIDVNIKDWSGRTALSTACRHKNVDMINLLLDNGALINSASDDFFTPLMEAICAFDHTTVRFLIEKGAMIHPLHQLAFSPYLVAKIKRDIAENYEGEERDKYLCRIERILILLEITIKRR
jgi:ankyrin repeat protein